MLKGEAGNTANQGTLLTNLTFNYILTFHSSPYLSTICYCGKYFVN